MKMMIMMMKKEEQEEEVVVALEQEMEFEDMAWQEVRKEKAQG